MAATISQRLRRAAELPHCEAVVVHTFPDGWTVRRLSRVSDLLREGGLMGNCLEWSEYLKHRDPNARLRPQGHTNERYFSLRDPNNLPHLTFVMSNWSGRVRGHSRQMRRVLGRHNADPKHHHVRRLYQWAADLPGPWYHNDGGRIGRLIDGDANPSKPVVPAAHRLREERSEPRSLQLRRAALPLRSQA
jgi:hypothetical protein